MIYWIIFIALELVRNYVLIEKRHIKPNYAGSFALRAFFGLVGIPIMYPEFDPLGGAFWGAIPVVCFEASSFYLLFDPILSILRRKPKPLIYRGKQSGWLDKLGLPYYITLKVFSLIILILSLCVIWEIPLPDWLTSLRIYSLYL